jgi:2-keto-3-deoxy-L-rhamnonate aldolase RhmA
MMTRIHAIGVLLLAASTALLAQPRLTDIPPQPRLNKVVEFFEKGIPPIGSFFNTVTARAGAGHATSGLDFAMLGMVNKRRILAKGNLQPDVMPMMRLPSNGREHVQYMIKQVLDIGMFGVLLPHINTREDALWAVRSMRYPQRLGAPDMEPRGQRGVGGVFVGPGDLSFSLGVDEDDPRLDQGFRFLLISAEGNVAAAAGHALQERDKRFKK